MKTPPKDLKTAGKALWKRVAEELDGVEDVREMLAELCRLCDRLAEVRAVIRKEGITVKGKRHPLLDVELRLSAQFGRIWKLCGLADPAPEEKRPPGRPPGPERDQWRG